LIDLHTHTTASDGLDTPADLVARAAAAGVSVLGVTDHDTVAGCGAAADACRMRGLAFVPGIEITAVRDEADVHVLGYFIDTASPGLDGFLAAQRQARIVRLRAMIARLAELGIHLDGEALMQPALDDPTKAIGRPAVARALVAAGRVRSTDEAFEHLLGRGRPAFVPRAGAPPEEVFARIHEAGGIASIAHPGLTGRDAWIPEFAAAGADAIEAYHSDHDEQATMRYLALAARHALLVTGGSDYHGDHTHAPAPGCVSLPREWYERLVKRIADGGWRNADRSVD
jgi:predicted metal-dependent phosphoesterase TrpH